MQFPAVPVGGWGRTAAVAVVGGPLVLAWGLAVCWPLHATQGLTFWVVNAAVGLAYFLAGAVLIDEVDHGVTGSVLLAVGVFWPLNWVDEWGTGPWPLVAALQGPLASLFAIWAILRYPRHWPRRQELVVTSLLVGFQLCSVLVVLTSVPRWHGLPDRTVWLTIHADPTAYRTLTTIYDVGGAVIAFAAVAALTLRVRQLIGIDRTVMQPVVGATWLAGCLTALADLALLQTNNDATQVPLYLVQETALLAVPAAYLVATLRRRTARAALPDLLVALEDAADPVAVQQALRGHLGDPGLVVAYRVEGGQHVDARGEPVDVEGHLGVRTRVAEAAVVLSDPSTGRYPRLMPAVARALAIVLDNDALSVLVVVRIAAVARSAERIGDAVAAERERFAADVDTRVQARLVGLQDDLTAMAHGAEDEFHEALEALRVQLRDARTALVELITDGPGGPVRRVGLAGALDTAARELGTEIQVRADPVALPDATATDLLLVASELMVNAVKHAGRATIQVDLFDRHPDLVLVVADDGIRGADASGSGLRGLAQRLGERDGTLAIDSPPGGGTRVTVRVPRPRDIPRPGAG